MVRCYRNSKGDKSMQPDEYSCKWADIDVGSEFNPDEGGQPVV